MSFSGRSAWTTKGKDNNTKQYQYISGLPLDGSSKAKGEDYYAVNLGVKAIQNQLNKLPSTSGLLVEDGIFGLKTSTAVKSAQTSMGLRVDGIAGSIFCKALFRPLIVKSSSDAGIDPKYLYGQISYESSFDPSAVGAVHSPDRGLPQINTETEGVTIEQAHNPEFALPWAAKRFKAALTKYSGKSNDLQIKCAILQHNSPAGADFYFKNGTYKSTTNQEYVDKVLGYTSEF